MEQPAAPAAEESSPGGTQPKQGFGVGEHPQRQPGAFAPDTDPSRLVAPARPVPALVPTADRLPLFVWVIAALFVAVELAFAGRYGFQQDELYFLVAGHHLALGYVDQPPLIPLLTRIPAAIAVDPTMIRVLPALTGGAVAVVAARQAALLGAGRTGRVLAALAVACTPVLLGASHLANTTSPALLAWSVVVLCASTAVLRDRPRWWLGAGVAAGLGLQTNNLVALLMVALALGLLLSGRAGLLRTRWPWLAAAVAAAIWAPNLLWQATHGWPQLVMASALRRENDSAIDYLAGLPTQLVYAGLLAIPVAIAGVVRLWRMPELRFLAITATVVYVYVLAWIPGKAYYASGVLPVVLAAGAVSTERWIARARRPGTRRAVAYGAIVLSMLVILPSLMPLWPVRDLSRHSSAEQQTANVSDTAGWPQLVRAVVAQNAALTRAGRPPTAVFTGYYGEAAALDVLGTADQLPPVLSGHNAFGTWGPGSASDATVLSVDAADRLRPYFARCRHLSTYDAPYGIHNDYTDLDLSVCTGPVAGWAALWPHLTHDE
ncbi:glycosyltransferase family 39 protein [Rugosimonospora acidiphila]|uniref:Glycosyltransferase family 39 protein n=1 Tax=Rugosimonospora acidiphila TaxID=556531 RepID=A0ABP9RUS2_9ACTN